MAAKKHNFGHYILTIFYVMTAAIVAATTWIAIAAVGGLFLQSLKTPLNLIIGLPMLLGGGGLALNKFASIIYVIFYPTYNKGTCPLCTKS